MLDRTIKGFPVRVARPPVTISGLWTLRSWTSTNEPKVECHLKHGATLVRELSHTLDEHLDTALFISSRTLMNPDSDSKDRRQLSFHFR